LDFQRGSLGNVGAGLRTELRHVVGEERGLVAGAGNGNVAEAGVEQVWVNAGVGVHEDALGGEALGAVASDGVAMVKMAVVVGVDIDLTVIKTG